jgi:hypothetical protein
MAGAAEGSLWLIPPPRPDQGRTATQESEETRMIRRISSVAAAAVVTLTAAGAWAQAAPGGFGTQGQLVIGAERLFGFVSTTETTELEQPDGTEKVTLSVSRFSLLGLNGPNIGAQYVGSSVASVFSSPRVGIDYFVIDKLSVGGSLVFITESSEEETEDPGDPTVTIDGPSTTAFVFAPRAGYALMFNDNIGFWPRAGFTYYSVSSEIDTGGGTIEGSENGLALTLEALFMIAPVDHFGFTVGPTLDFGLTGSREIENPPPGGTVEYDRQITALGIQAGLAVWF